MLVDVVHGCVGHPKVSLASFIHTLYVWFDLITCSILVMLKSRLILLLGFYVRSCSCLFVLRPVVII